ncbi:unnamed protein product [Hymenolepis diminuta]|uniref:Uncharacterized protein n=1 Tax=Hymenolepis diminuta TaxID=6216 RepID=A0A564ZC88_HYMDI|nr:unnamed protein product [Hymenolepis diminuta]
MNWPPRGRGHRGIISALFTHSLRTPEKSARHGMMDENRGEFDARHLAKHFQVFSEIFNANHLVLRRGHQSL